MATDPEPIPTPPIAPPIAYAPARPGPAPPAPVGDRERFATLDVLRGVAVLGILLVNVQFFAFTFAEASQWQWDQFAGLDKLSRAFVNFFAFGKFITIFSILFGMGLALQSERARRAVRPFAGLYTRRLVFLLLFGLIHGILFWYGDILSLYAVIGFVALLCRNVRPAALLITAAILLFIPILGLGGCALRDPGADWGNPWAWDQLGAEISDASQPITDDPSTTAPATPSSAPASRPAASDTARINARIAELMEFLGDEERIYRSGTWTEMLAIRSFYYLVILIPTYALLFSWRTVALFFLGMVFIRAGLFDDTDRRRPVYRRMLLVGLLIGVPLQALSLAIQMGGDKRAVMVFAQFAIDSFATLALALAYTGGLALICLRPAWVARLRPVAAVGRMALTNYLSHTLICVFIFYSFGLGLFGTVSHPKALLIVAGIYAAQLILSPIWLRRFHFGPFEWLWRSLTYWRLQPFVRT